MFIVYCNFIALACFVSRDEAGEYIREQQLTHEFCQVDYVPEDEDLWYSINSRA